MLLPATIGHKWPVVKKFVLATTTSVTAVLPETMGGQWPVLKNVVASMTSVSGLQGTPIGHQGPVL